MEDGWLPNDYNDYSDLRHHSFPGMIFALDCYRGLVESLFTQIEN